MMTRKEAREALKELNYEIDSESYLAEALDMGIKSLGLWDNFIEELAGRCNNATCAAEWDVYRNGIELIKKEFDERIG